jgi:aminomethyltransferase
MVPFAGWDMPVQYKSIVQEHRAVRAVAGMFDVSHMGEFRFRGTAALDLLQWLTPNDVSTVAVGASQYSCLLRPDAGIIDDIFIYRLDDEYLVVVNAANVAKVGSWLDQHRRANAEAIDVSDQTALIAVQGPRAVEAVAGLATPDVTTLPRRGIRSFTVAGRPALVARTGYTGEDGAEIFCDPTDAVTIWRALLDQPNVPIVPCGLGARDTLRLEAGNLLYGHDMDETVNPWEAGLGFVVKIDKGDFIGREELVAAEARGPRTRLAGFTMLDRGVPRSGFAVECDGRYVGHVTSGSYAPTLDRNIGLAYVEPPLATVGQRFHVIIRDQPLAAEVVKLPFYRSKSRSVQPS